MSATKTTAHYTIEDLGSGIHAAIARPEGFAICNSGMVDLGAGGAVFDTGLTPDSAQDLKSSSELVLGGPPALCVISHRHLDHALGASEFPGIPIWGTRRAREVILETHDQTMAELKREQLEKDIHELESHRGEMRSETARADLDFLLLMDRALLANVGRLKLVPPDQTFETRVSLPGTRGAELVSFGSGHTEADAIMFLPAEKVLFAGDLVCLGIQPSMGNGDPEHWLTVLDEIERLRPERIVPGHGLVTTVEGLDETRGYLSGVLQAAGASKNAKLPATIRRWEGTLSLQENLKFARGWLSARRGR